MKNMKNVKLDKQSGATIILAVIVAFFMGAMFLVNNSLGRSYALPSSENDDVPENMVVSLDSITGDIDAVIMALGKSIDANWNVDADKYGIYKPANRIHDANGYDFYCLEPDKGVVSGNYNVPTLADNDYEKVIYILEKAYSSSTATSLDYYINQHAIWYTLIRDGKYSYNNYTEKENGYEHYYVGSRDYMLAIDTAANNGNPTALAIIKLYNEATVQSKIKNSVQINGLDDFKLSEVDGEYLESTDLTVAVQENAISNFTGYTVTSENDQVEIYRITGAGYEKVSSSDVLKRGDSFRIRISTDNADEIDSIVSNIRISGIFDVEQLYYYSYSGQGAAVEAVQKILYVNSVSKSESVEVPLNFVKISKQDVTNSEELAGASLKIEKINVDGTYTFVTEWVSSSSARYVYLEPGNYRLTETVAPEGYELSSETIQFTVGADNKPTQVVVMYNTPYVDTPDTAEGLPVYVYIIGTIILVIGTTMVYTSVKTRKN